MLIPCHTCSDNKAHKVSVAVLRLASSFRHYSAPAINPVAYLQCLTINTTDYTLLASKTVNVFLNNAFVSKTEISTVRELCCRIGCHACTL